MPSPEQSPFAEIAEDVAARMREHDECRRTEQFEEEVANLRRISADFINAVRIATFVFPRYPDSLKWLQCSFSDDLLESAISILALGEQGVFNVGRRELRYMLETLVKQVYVDQQLPGDASVDERLDYLHEHVPRSSIKPVDELKLRMVSPTDDFRSAVKSCFGATSGYVHPSRRQFDERLVRASRGEFAGFESAATLASFSKLVFAVYDLLLVLVFEGIGPAFTGDVFVQLLDEDRDWKFHRGRFVEGVVA